MEGEEIYRNRFKVLVGIVLIFLLSFFLVFQQVTERETTDFKNSSAYIEQNEEGEMEMDIEGFVGDNGTVERRSQGSYVYKEDQYMTEFTYIGIYKGNLFSSSESVDGEEVMRISSEMTPDDGVMETYLMAKVEDEEVVVNLYVDQDFKDNHPELNISWGSDWENFRSFNFTEVGPGIYMDVIKGDYISRFVHGAAVSDANIAIGTFTKEDIENERDDLEAAVFVK